ncbi:Ros/MucR family transcriptional regulator [Methylobacterium sp. CM6257]
MPALEERVLIAVTAAIVEAYSANNSLPVSTLPPLIATVHGALKSLQAGRPTSVGQADQPTPIQIRRSITPEALISFIDGKRYKTLKRHLASHGLTPSGYRKRFGLPEDYPMVAEVYRQHRSRIAKAIGLGVPIGK